MYQTLHQRKGLRHGNARRADLSRFTPMTQVARAKVDSLIAAGAQVLAVQPAKVVLRRQESVATVDDWGRVSWEHAKPFRPVRISPK
jgi:hypothetical protein